MQKLLIIFNKYRIDIQICMWALGASIIIMIAEFGSFTFVSDIYPRQLNNIFPNDGISADARFLPEFLFQTVFYGTYLPSIFLLMLTASLTVGGYLMILRMNILSGKLRIIPILILVLHPFLFSHSAYIVNRLQTSCSIIFATLAALTLVGKQHKTIARILFAGILLSLALMSFQPSIGIFLVCAFFLHADDLFEGNLQIKTTLRRLLSISLAIGLSIVIYEGCVFLARHFQIIESVRVHNMMSLPGTMHDLKTHIAENINLLKDILFEKTQFFPAGVKWLLLVNFAWLAINIYRQGQTIHQKVGHVLFLIVCFLSFYFSIAFVYPIIPLPRIMPGLAFVWFFIFLFALKFGNRISRPFAMFSVIVCVLIFSIQFNIMHERLTVKNEIDKQITWEIISRIQIFEEQDNQPQVVALVGVLDHHSMPYWPKYSGVFKRHLIPDMLQSVYQFDWSKYRLLEFYYPCRLPNEAQRQEADKMVENSPLWPEEGSVIQGNGFIAVALSRP